MNYLITILRLIHIVGGIFWVGAALMLTFFISPTAAATYEAGQKFLAHMMQRTAFNKAILVSASASVFAGIVLYLIDSNFLRNLWMHSGPGIGFGVGGIFGLLGFMIGLAQNRRSHELAQLGRIIQSQGGPPNQDQREKLTRLQAKLKTGGLWNAIFLLLAAILMSTARFLVF
ncbi:hypothetical protein KQH61_05200 [bacterium]|nr:hypothetical protein [bacterium]MCB2179297.1 hypothetical protein [bacterium]